MQPFLAMVNLLDGPPFMSLDYRAVLQNAISHVAANLQISHQSKMRVF